MTYFLIDYMCLSLDCKVHEDWDKIVLTQASDGKGPGILHITERTKEVLF